jgi:hypothetical protein
MKESITIIEPRNPCDAEPDEEICEYESLEQAFIDMDKSKDELFEAIDIICKDYKEKHINKL